MASLTASGSQTVVGVADTAGPFSHGFAHGILKSSRAALYRDHFRAQKAHAVYIKRLTLGVLLAHKYHTFHSQKCRCRSRCHAMLSRTRLCYQPDLSHLLCKQSLPEYIVDLMRSGMVKILSFKIDLCTTKILGHLLCIVES